MRRHGERGSALLISLVLVLVLSVIAVGLVRFAGVEVAGAQATRKHEAVVACAEAGRQLLLSRFHALGLQPLQLEALDVDLDAAGDTTVRAGHVDGLGAQVVLSDPREGRSAPLGDITNVIPSPVAGGGVPYRTTVTCDDHGRRIEVEFGVRFGL
jgi:hypothetical protein